MPAKTHGKDAGGRWQRIFPAAKRGDYLALQLDLERVAPAIYFLTPGLTNAITTEAHLNSVIFESLTAGLAKALSSRRLAAVRDEVFERMGQRQAQLDRRMAARQVDVRVLFLQGELARDLRRAPDQSVPRYQLLLELAQQGVVSFRLISKLDAATLEAAGGSFALIFNQNRGRALADIALARAAQATSPRLGERQLVAQNTPEALARAALFERYWNAALDEPRSRELVAAAVARAGSRRQRR